MLTNNLKITRMMIRIQKYNKFVVMIRQIKTQQFAMKYHEKNINSDTGIYVESHWMISDYT